MSCWCPHFHVESLAAAFCIVSVSLPHPQSQSHTELIPRLCKQALYAYTTKQLLETDCTLFKFDTVAASFISGTCGSACVMPSILPTILSDRGIKKTLTPAAPKDRSVIHLGPHACLHVGYCQTSGPSWARQGPSSFHFRHLRETFLRFDVVLLSEIVLSWCHRDPLMSLQLLLFPCMLFSVERCHKTLLG